MYVYHNFFLKRSTLKNWGVVKWAEEIGGNPRLERRRKYGQQNQEGWRVASSQPYGQGLRRKTASEKSSGNQGIF